MPTLDEFRKQAKDWLKEVRNRNPGPVKRLRLAYPKAPRTPVLRDIQQALARDQGYESWHALRSALERQPVPARREVPDARAVDSHLDRVALFLQYACWNDNVHGRGDYSLRESAVARLPGKHPEIATDSLYTTVVCGHIAEAERHLAERPALVNEKGGPWNWEPYGFTPLWGLPNDEAGAVVVAELLLAHGADPTRRSNENTTAVDAARLRGLHEAADRIAAAASGTG